MAEYPIKVHLEYEEKASRIQLFVRFIIGTLWALIAGIWGLIASIALFFQWFHILILGRRSEGLNNFMAGYFRFYTRVQGYIWLFTDRIPPISGEE